MIAIFPEIISTAKRRDVELLAIQVRRYFAGNAMYQPRLDLVNVMAAIGIKLDRMPIEDDAILCVRDVAGSFEVVAIVNQTIEDQMHFQFLLAHLIGHFLLHVQPLIAEGSWRTSGLREVVSPMHRYSRALVSVANDQKHEIMEREADEFAAAILLPLGMLKRASAKIDSMASLATFFGVAESVVRRRSVDLNGVDHHPLDFTEAESKIKQSTTDNQNQDGVPTKAVLYSEQPAREMIRMPRSVAANNYQSMKVRTEGAQQLPNKESTPIVAGADQSQTKPKGMARIRELARQLDRSEKS